MTSATSGRRATIRDVADVAGVSHATVSRYLNGRSYVSPEAGVAIDAAVASVGYLPNNSARALVLRKTFSAAFVVREHSDLFFNDTNLSAMAIGANATFSARGYQMSILIVESDASAARVLDIIGGGAVDGALLLAMHVEDPLVLALAKSGTPIITASAPTTDPTITTVDTDNEGGARRIAECLLATRPTQVAVINGPPDAPVSAMRERGYREALGARYEDDLALSAGEWTPDAGRQVMDELLRRRPGIDAVVAASDALAAGAIDSLNAHGRRVPDDVAIVGFDDSVWAERTVPRLTTVRQDPRETGVRMAELLLDQIDGQVDGGQHVIFDNEVIWRDSAQRC